MSPYVPFSDHIHIIIESYSRSKSEIGTSDFVMIWPEKKFFENLKKKFVPQFFLDL